MALNLTVLTSGTAAAVSATTANISPTYTPVIAVFVGACDSPAPTEGEASVSGCGLTWTLISGASVTYAFRRRIWVFQGTGTPSSGTLSLDTGNGTGNVGIAWVILESPDIDSLGTPAVDGLDGDDTSMTVTLTGSPAAGDASFAAVFLENNINPTWESGWDELADISESGNVRRMSVAWDIDRDSTPLATFSSTSPGMVGFYIFASAGGPPIVTGAATLTGVTGLTAASLLEVKAVSQIVGGTGMTALSNLQIPVSSQLIGGTNLTGTSLVQVRAASELVAAALLVGTGLNEIKMAANLLGSGQINSSGFLQVLGLAQLIASGQIDGTGLLQIIASSQVIGGANLLGTALLQVLGATQLVGSGLLEASGDISNGIVYGRANLLGNAELSGTPTMLVLAGSQLVGTGGLTAAPFLIIPSSVVLSGSGVLQGSSILVVSAASLLSGSAELSAIGYNLGQVVLGAANLTGNASITGTGKVTVLADVVLTGLASLSGSSSLTVYGDSIISGSANLSSVPMLIIQAIAELVGSGAIVATGKTFEASITTPDNRTYVIPMEVRTFVINGETRIYVIPAE